MVILAWCGSLDELERAQQFFKLRLTVLKSKYSLVHPRRLERTVALFVIVANWISDEIWGWTWIILFQSRCHKPIIGSSKWVASLRSNGAGQRLANFLHICVSKRTRLGSAYWAHAAWARLIESCGLGSIHHVSRVSSRRATYWAISFVLCCSNRLQLWCVKLKPILTWSRHCSGFSELSFEVVTL